MMERYLIIPLNGYHPEIGAWLSSMQDVRNRTKKALNGLDDQSLNWIDPRIENSIGTLLYHIAAIEMDWLFSDVMEGAPFSQEVADLLLHNVRDQKGKLIQVTDETLAMHLHRLDTTRQVFLSAFEGMMIGDFHRARQMQDYQVTPQWVIHHLMQHEAEHRGQIGEIRKLSHQALMSRDH